MSIHPFQPVLPIAGNTFRWLTAICHPGVSFCDPDCPSCPPGMFGNIDGGGSGSSSGDDGNDDNSTSTTTTSDATAIATALVVGTDLGDAFPTDLPALSDLVVSDALLSFSLKVSSMRRRVNGHWRIANRPPLLTKGHAYI
jgi:hypothetical protein